MLARAAVAGCIPRVALVLAVAVALAGCARSGGYGYGAAYQAGASGPTRYYPPPGPPDDPWGPYVREASARFQVPEQWVRAVMRQESGGEEQATSSAGAMGLMQVMPETYAGLRDRYGLGDDPYDPHNNILAGTAYIREMYDRYGAPGFLAAYNAGPDRLDQYLASGQSLPDQTVSYLAAVTPNLGAGTRLTGPLAMFAAGSVAGAAPSVASLAAGCDVDAAYDPDHPCRALEQAAVAPAVVPVAAAPVPGGCDADAAYDPGHPCTPAQEPVAAAVQEVSLAPCDPDAAFDPARGDCQGPPRAAPAPVPAATTLYSPAAPPPATAAPSPAGGSWAIQVGAFASPGLARAIAEGARAEAPGALGAASLALPTVVSLNGAVLYRARLAGLSAPAAADACRQLNRLQLPCLLVRPGGSEVDLAQPGT